MGIQPVDYKKNSSSAQFNEQYGEPPKAVPINNNTAPTINKDINLGRVEDLDKAQQTRLDSILDNMDNKDDVKYTDDEQREVGRNQIDTEGVEKTSNGDKVGNTAGAVAIGAGNLFAAGIEIGIRKLTKLPAAIACLIAAGLAIVGVGFAIPAANAFDPQYNERTSQKKQADSTNEIMNTHAALLNDNVDEMQQDEDIVKNLTEAQTAIVVDAIGQIGNLRAQAATLRLQGNIEEAEKIEAKIEGLIKEGATNEDASNEEIQSYQEKMEQYNFDVNEGKGIAESGALVSEFLGQGKTMGTYGIVNSVFLGAAAIQAMLAVPAAISTIKFPWDAPIAFAASVIDIAIAVVLTTAAGIMINKTKNEFQCGSKGDDMQDVVENLSGANDASKAFVEETDAAYIQLAADAAKAAGDAQKGSEQGVKNSVVAMQKDYSGDEMTEDNSQQ